MGKRRGISAGKKIQHRCVSCGGHRFHPGDINISQGTCPRQKCVQCFGHLSLQKSGRTRHGGANAAHNVSTDRYLRIRNTASGKTVPGPHVVQVQCDRSRADINCCAILSVHRHTRYQRAAAEFYPFHDLFTGQDDLRISLQASLAGKPDTCFLFSRSRRRDLTIEHHRAFAADSASAAGGIDFESVRPQNVADPTARFSMYHGLCAAGDYFQVSHFSAPNKAPFRNMLQCWDRWYISARCSALCYIHPHHSFPGMPMPGPGDGMVLRSLSRIFHTDRTRRRKDAVHFCP